MIEQLQILAESIWVMLIDSAFLLFIGLLLAGLVSIVLDSKRFVRFMKGSDLQQVFRAALIGVPLPLCSCSVLPVAHQLRQSGVSKAGTASFLISTPESGVDSIMLTYTLTDPLMTIARPITAFLTAFAAGGVESLVGKDDSPEPVSSAESIPANCDDSCCGSKNEIVSDKSIRIRLWSGLRYGVTDLLSDIAPYLLIGYVLAGLVSLLLGGNLLSLPEGLIDGWGGYAGAILIGLPLYICATSSTPMAAAMLAGGFSPGAVLVFLMVGPATNAASLVVVSKILKGAALVRYLLAILVVSILAGLALDRLYLLWPQEGWSTAAGHQHDASLLDQISAVLLSALILYYTGRRLLNRVRGKR
ncbi:MAG: SO_0444 family Cu/Zn efflux transporter [bacterium]|nr:SO_0444 family Cu/Zn efflux transporter [bacterium]